MQAFLAAHPAGHVWQGAFIERMDYAYAAADVVVSRSAAGTVSELCLVGKPVIFVPSPNVAEDHQTKNARPSNRRVPRCSSPMPCAARRDAAGRGAARRPGAACGDEPSHRGAGASRRRGAHRRSRLPRCCPQKQSKAENNVCKQDMKFENVYFLGIGGIGMSALARYFLHEGRRVAGYDRTPSSLTEALEAEGASVHYEDDVRRIPAPFLDPATTIVVYTPAVPHDLGEFVYFREQGFTIEKRSQMLGHLAEGKIRHGRGRHARQDDHHDPRGVAQPCADGRRLGLPGRSVEEFRRQPRAGRRTASGRRGRRVRPFVPAPLSRRGGRNLRGCRPPGHLRHARGGQGGLLAVRAADPRGRQPRYQAGRGDHARQSAHHGLPLCL